MRFNLVIASLGIAVVSLVASEARAQDATPAAAPATAPASAAPASPDPAQPAGQPVQTDKPKKDDDAEEDWRPVAITLNPLSMALLRFGANVEYMFAHHHGLILNPYFQTVSVSAGAGPSSSESSYTNFGAELGYRFYTGNRGANGFFIGPAVFVQRTNTSATVTSGGQSSTAESGTMVYGGIVDLGGQHVFKNGFTIGGGAGVMYLTTPDEPKNTSSTVKFAGVLPRVLFTAGYSF